MAAALAGVEFLVLGPLEVRDERGPVATGSPQQRALLALLVLNANTVISRDRIVDELWAERPPETAAKLVQVYVSRLRKVIGAEMLVTQRPGYVLRVAPEQIDLHRFRALVRQGRDALARGAAADAAPDLRAALGLWRGPALADLVYEPFVQAEAAGLEEERLAALEDRIEADLALGRELVGELETLVERHSLRERLRGQQMLALYRAGRQADALRAYQDARRLLVDELGIEPGRSLRELEHAMLRQDPKLDLRPAAAGAVEPAGVFVGRAAELETLTAALQSAFAGRGQLVLVAGEPGIGKSRLADELTAHARAQGARVVVGRCWEAGGAPAYWPWVQTLRALLREADPEAVLAYAGDAAGALAQILPELRERLGALPESAEVPPEVARFQVFEAITTVLRQVSREAALVLLVDDLHAADPSSLLLLQFVARELAGMRVLVLACYRDVDAEPDPVFARVVAELARESPTRRLSLRGLAAEEVERYVELTAANVVTPELAATLREDTGGNPLFLAEIVRLIASDRAQLRDAQLHRLAIPPTVSEAIGRRLERLDDECRRVLALAAVIGREFPLDLLADVTAVSGDALLDLLEDATATRVITEVPGLNDRLRFAHVLMRDSLYQGLTAARRIRLHRQVFEALERRESGSAAALAQLAHHAIAARDLLKAIHYARAAGDRALAQLAYEEAARLYQRALEAADARDGLEATTRCELLLALGEARARAGEATAASEAYLAAAELARRLELRGALARAALGYGGRIVWARAGGDEHLVPLLEEGIAAAPKQEIGLRAQLLARLAGALRDERRRERRDELSRQAVALARQSGDKSALAHALAGRAHAIFAPDTLAECQALADELHAVATPMNDLERLVVAHMLREMVLLTRGEIASGQHELAAAELAAQALRQPAQLWEVRASRAMLALARGRFDQAEPLIEEALSLGERTIRDFALSHHRIQRFTLADFRGELGGEEAAVRELADAYPARPMFRCALTYLWSRTGQGERAGEELAELVSDDVSSLPFDHEWLFAMSLLAEACWLIGALERAPALYEALEPWSGLSAVDVGEGVRGSVARYLGLLAATMGRRSDAQRHLEAAVAANRTMGLKPWEARAREDLARVLVATG